MGSVMKTPMTFREKVLFGISLLLFAVLNLVPGLTGSYADAAYGGGGGSGYQCNGNAACALSSHTCTITCPGDGGPCWCTTTL